MAHSHSKPSLSFSIDVNRDRKILIEHLIRGLINGAIFGRGIAIKSRDKNTIYFSSNHSISDAPEHGSFRVEASDLASKVYIELSFKKQRLIHALKSAFYAACFITLLTLVFGWLISFSVPITLLTAIIGDIVSWRRKRKHYRLHLETYIANSLYLKTL